MMLTQLMLLKGQLALSGLPCKDSKRFDNEVSK